MNEPGPPSNSYVLPEHKMVYISVTKVACTSLRWMIADLAGEDLQSFQRAAGGQQSRLMTIHGGRSRWKYTPQLNKMPVDELKEISTENGWFIFAATRDPWSRLWAAWQSKFLVRHVSFMDRYSDEPWFPRVPRNAQDVVEDYRKFVFERPWEKDPNLSRDSHFWPQVRSIRPQAINYTKIYDLSEMSVLISDIRRHLESLKMPSELYLPRANETPLAMTQEILEGGVLEAVRDAYADDFDAFGDRWSSERLKLAPSGWTQDAVDHAAYHTVANERIGDLRTEIIRLRRSLNVAGAEMQQLKSQQKRPGRITKTVRYALSHQKISMAMKTLRKVRRVPGMRSVRILRTSRRRRTD